MYKRCLFLTETINLKIPCFFLLKSLLHVIVVFLRFQSDLLQLSSLTSHMVFLTLFSRFLFFLRSVLLQHFSHNYPLYKNWRMPGLWVCSKLLFFLLHDYFRICLSQYFKIFVIFSLLVSITSSVSTEPQLACFHISLQFFIHIPCFCLISFYTYKLSPINKSSHTIFRQNNTTVI